MTRSLQFVLGLAIALLAAVAPAQVFKIEGGKSTLFDADGGSLSIKGPNSDSEFGAGVYAGHFQYGAVVRTKVLGYTVTAGDDSVRFDLPTDVFESTAYFSSRGVGISKNSADSGFYAFGGLTSRWLGTSFFRAARSEDPVGVFFFHHRITDTLHFYSRDIFTEKYTALQALQWTPEKWLKTSATAGIGSGKPYLATAADADIDKWRLKGSYVAVSPDFRRIIVPDIQNSEPERENLQATYRFSRDATVSASHRNLLQPLTLDGDLARASMDQVNGTFRIKQTYFGTGLFTSRFQGQDSWGTNFYVGQRYRQFLDVSANYFASKSGDQKVDSMITGTFREIITPRLNVLQVLNYSNGNVSLSYGGEFITNRFNASVDYQTVYLPFRTSKPFQQTLSFNTTVHVVGPFSVTAASSVAPDGRVRYTFGASTYLYRYGSLMPSWGQSHESYRFPKYVVQGVVKDEQGRPLSGAAVQIGSDLVYSDGQGRFLYRSSKNKPMKFAIVPSEFLTAGIYEVLKAPDSVTPEREAQAQDVQVVVRRLTKEQAALRGLLARLTTPAHE
jgi:hypothetical protein